MKRQTSIYADPIAMNLANTKFIKFVLCCNICDDLYLIPEDELKHTHGRPRTQLYKIYFCKLCPARTKDLQEMLSHTELHTEISYVYALTSDEE